ncbi:MAG: hypothetical protein GY765_16965, partial [bacterium]|nr:hypothetical protein [bacterium]
MYRTKFKLEEYLEAQQMLLGLNEEVKELVIADAEDDDFKTFGHCETGVGVMDGRAVERVILILKGCGCEWTQNKDGGCVMCGHYAGSSKGTEVPPENMKKQFDDGMQMYDFRKYPILCVYNGGSFLNEKEITPDIRRYMLKTVNANPHIRRLIIESRTDYITAEVLDEIEAIMTDTVVEIGVGLESYCDVIRNLLLNKGVDTMALIEAADKFRNRKNIKLLAYVLINPPFLTESEAIEDSAMTIEFAHDIGASIVSLEAVSIQHATLVSYMAEAGHYKPPWIWSMFEIIRRTSTLGIECRLGGFEFFPIPREFTSNCSACNEKMINSIQQFNASNDMMVLQNSTCSNRCDLVWREELKRTDKRNYPTRVIETLLSIDKNNILKRLSCNQGASEAACKIERMPQNFLKGYMQ